MKVSITKFAVIHCNRSSTLQYKYNINHQPLNVTDQHPYLGSQIYVMGIPHKCSSTQGIKNIELHQAEPLYVYKRS